MNFYSLEDYRYHLPESLIAQVPVYPPESARLLVLRGSKIEDRFFSDLPEILPRDGLLFINDTRVLKARIRTNATILRPSGTEQKREVELLFLEYIPSDSVTRFESMVFPGDAFPIGAKCEIGGKVCMVESISYRGRVFSSVDIQTEQELYDFLEKNGEYPIPPYISASQAAQEGYQTVFAEIPGSLAAPTASLHFSDKLLNSIGNTGTEVHSATLHVGIGTFKTVNESDIRNHRIHPEVGIIPIRIFETIAKKRIDSQSIIGVGTTMIRLLESLPFVWHHFTQKDIFDTEVQEWWNSCYCEASKYEVDRVQYLAIQDGIECVIDTKQKNDICKELASQNEHDLYLENEDAVKLYRFVRIRNESGISIVFDSSLYIYDGYTPRVATGMITNFHLPESTLLMMVSALCQKDRIDLLYNHAISQKYRFYSFGDGCFLTF